MLPQNIATSGEVYALYSDARAKIRAREETKYKPAYAQLEQVVGTDPNFAPGWATLAVLKNLLGSSGEQGATTTAQQDARKAIALAPNLAAAHAALGLTLGRGPGAEAELRHALQLDPNDIEAMNWLAATLDNSRSMEKLALYTKIADIEPLWWPAVLNKLNLLYKIGNMAAVEQELARVEKIGDVPLATTIKLDILYPQGRSLGCRRPCPCRIPKQSRPQQSQSSVSVAGAYAAWLFGPRRQTFAASERLHPADPGQ